MRRNFIGAPAGGGGGGSFNQTIQDEGVSLAQRPTFNFIGAGVTAVDNAGSNRTDITIPGGGGSGYATIQDEGTALTARTILNFIGAGVTAVDNVPSTRTDVTISTPGHNLLSATHPDTTPAAAVRGDLVTGQAGPVWARLAIGANLRALVSDGIDALWAVLTKSHLPAVTVYTDQANTWTAGAQNMAAATSLTLPTAAGAAPTADGDIRYDSTQDRYVSGGGTGAQTGGFPRVLAVGRPLETLTNTVTTEQNYTSIFTIPANFFIADKVLRVSILFEWATGATGQSQRYRLKLGSTNVFEGTAVTASSGLAARGAVAQFLIWGTGAPGASVGVECSITVPPTNTANQLNDLAMPILVATNGSLTVVPSIQFGGTATTNTVTLRTYLVEELN